MLKDNPEHLKVHREQNPKQRRPSQDRSRFGVAGQLAEPSSVYVAGRQGRPAFLPPDFGAWSLRFGDKHETEYPP